MRTSILLLALTLTGCPVQSEPDFIGDLGELGFSDGLGGSRDQPVLLGARFFLVTEDPGPLYSDASDIEVLTTSTCDDRGVRTGDTRDELLALLNPPQPESGDDDDATGDDDDWADDDDDDSWNDDPEEFAPEERDDCTTRIQILASQVGRGEVRLFDHFGELADRVAYTVAAADRATIRADELPSLPDTSTADPLHLFAGAAAPLTLEVFGGSSVLRHDGDVGALLTNAELELGSVDAGTLSLTITPTDAGPIVVAWSLPEGNPALVSEWTSVGADEVTDVRVRVDSVTDNSRDRCFGLEAYARLDGAPVLSAPMAWTTIGGAWKESTEGNTNSVCLAWGGTGWAAASGSFGDRPYHQLWLNAHAQASPGTDPPAGVDEPAEPPDGCSMVGGSGLFAGLLLLAGRRRR